MKKGLLLYSGGLDSTALLYEKQDDIAVCVFFDYGSKQNRTEYFYAKHHCNHLGIKLIRIKIMMPFNNAMNDVSISTQGLDNVKTVVPFRNGIFLSYAVGICEDYDLNKIYLGIHNPEDTIYKDTTDSFIKSFESMIVHGYKLSVSLENPLQMMSKKEIASILKKFNVSVKETYSCYEGTIVPCGICSPCIKRQEL